MSLMRVNKKNLILIGKALLNGSPFSMIILFGIWGFIFASPGIHDTEYIGATILFPALSILVPIDVIIRITTRNNLWRLWIIELGLIILMVLFFLIKIVY